MPKPRLTPKNRAIVEKALRAMLRWPETYDQGSYIFHDPNVRSSGKRPAPYCGTEACIAGHVALAAGAVPINGLYVSLRGQEVRVGDLAEQIMGPNALMMLFEPDLDGWPEKFAHAFDRAKTPKTRAKIAVTRVRHWLKTGE